MFTEEAVLRPVELAILGDAPRHFLLSAWKDSFYCVRIKGEYLDTLHTTRNLIQISKTLRDRLNTCIVHVECRGLGHVQTIAYVSLGRKIWG